MLKASSASTRAFTTQKWSSFRDKVGASAAFLVLASMLAGFGYLVQRQETHKLLLSSSCRRIDIELTGSSDTYYSLSDFKNSPFSNLAENADKTGTDILFDPNVSPDLYFSYFNGLYTSNFDDIRSERPTYYDSQGKNNEATAGRFYYCEEETVWVFTIGNFDDDVERGACGQWLMRSEPTDEFLLENVPSDSWIVWTGFTRPVSVNMKCMDCTKAPGNSGCSFNGNCSQDGTCVCELDKTGEEWFGENCQAMPPCDVVDAFVHGDTSEDYHQVAHFMPLKAKGKRVLSYQRPVYWNKRPLGASMQNFLLYTGSRWYHTDWPIEDVCPDPNSTCGMANFASFFENNFHAYWFGTRIHSTKYISELTTSFTPVGLRWLTLERENKAKGDFGKYGYTYDEGLSTHCFKHDCNLAGLCGENGDCAYDTRYIANASDAIRMSCKCKNGSSGHFCQFGYNNSYVANQLNSQSISGHCNEFFCDYLYDQDLDAGVDCAETCRGIRDSKACWNTKPPCKSDPVKIG